MMNIATWNVNSLNVRLTHLIKWLQETPVDVLALQELKLNQDQFPRETLLASGYQAVWFGQKTYNGVALLAKSPIVPTDVTFGIPGYEDPQRRVIAATIEGIRFISVYCVNGESLMSEKFRYKLTWFEALLGYIQTALAQYPLLVVMGDFNIAPQAIDTYDPLLWQNRVICSKEERELFQRLLSYGLYDSLRTLYPDQALYSWWDYRAGMFRHNYGLRIDHILVSHALWPRVTKGAVDAVPRGWERPSDHTPVMLALK